MTRKQLQTRSKKDLADLARKRGATIHGMLRGYATLADGYHPSSPEPEGKWEQRVMALALKSAELPGGADDVDAVVAHGTGTLPMLNGRTPKQAVKDADGREIVESLLLQFGQIGRAHV